MVKAQIDVQFNWIFILIIGAIILSFFVGAAVWYKGVQEQKITGQIVVDLDSLLKTAQESPKTARTTTIPDITLSFTCSLDCSDYGCASDFSGGGISRSTETDIVFTHHTLSGAQLITWGLEWTMPFKIANILYVTSDTIRYIIVYDEAHSALAYAVNSLLSENSYLTKETIKITDASDLTITDKNDAYVRIISFVDDLPTQPIEDALGEYDEKNPTWDIITISGTEEKGTVTYSDGDASYTGLPLLIGALFSADKEFYACNVQKAILQAKIVSEVYAARTHQLYESFGTEKEYCTYYYEPSIQDTMLGIPDDIEDGLDVSSAIETLEEANNYAVMKGCPRLY